MDVKTRINSMEPTVLSLIDGYREEQSKHQRTHWFYSASFIKRICQPRVEFLRLAKEEAAFQIAFSVWLEGVFRSHDIAAADAERLKTAMKNFKERIQNRSAFLMIFAAIIGVPSFALTDAHDLFGYIARCITSGFLVLSLLERKNCVDHASIAEEITNQIEQWIRTRPC